MSVPPERRPALVERDGRRKSPADDGYLFSPEHLDNAFHIESEMLVAFARQMLYYPDEGADPYDTPIIRQRRQEAARAALDVLWALMAEKNAWEGSPTPQPALVALRPQRKNRRLPRT
jgi:hypothetical protein